MLKGSIKTIIELFLAIQLMVYIQMFNIQLPGVPEIILKEFKKLIEFQAINPEKLMQTFVDE